MIGTDHEHAVLTGDGILGDHSFAGLDVTFTEIGDRLPQRINEFGGDPVDGSRDVEGRAVIWPDELERELGVVLVRLKSVGQTNRNETRLHPRAAGSVRSVRSTGAHALDGELAEATGETRILAAAYS